MALPDLSGSLIQDTYQRVLHIGENNIITDGTGSQVLDATELAELQTLGSHNMDWENLSYVNQNLADTSAPAFATCGATTLTSAGPAFTNRSQRAGLGFASEHATSSINIGHRGAAGTTFDYYGNITASSDISVAGRFIGDTITLGDTAIATPSYDFHIRNAGAATATIESWGNNNAVLQFLSNQSNALGEPDFSVGQYHTDGGFQVRSELKTFITVGADNGDEIKASGSLNVTSDITASGNISSSGNAYSNNIDTIQYSFQNNNSQEADHYYGPNSQGPGYYYWNKKYSSYPNMGLSHFNSGFRLPYKAELVSCKYIVHCLSTFATNETASYTASLIVRDELNLYDQNGYYPVTSSTIANGNLDEMTRAGVTMSVQNGQYLIDVPVSGTYSEGSMVYPRTNVSIGSKNWRGNFELKIRRIK